MEITELDRRTPIRLPRLADDDSVVLPEPLTVAHMALHKTANEAAQRAIALTNDTRWSESEKQRQLSELCEATTPEIARVSIR